MTTRLPTASSSTAVAIRVVLMATASITLTACQSHLPELDSYPNQTKLAKPSGPPSTSAPKPETTPKATDVVVHIQCELAKILNTHVNSSVSDQTSSEFLHRLQNNPKITPLAQELTDFNFVATVQLTLEVTEAEGLTPSLTFQNALMGKHAGSLGAQLSGTQDRTETLNYSIDLSRLQTFDASFCQDSSAEAGQSGIQGDLGLADIVADGLLSLDASAKRNVYSTSGPTPPTIAHNVIQTGTLYLPLVSAASPPPRGGSKDSKSPVTVDESPKYEAVDFNPLRGTMLFAPQSAGVQTQGTVTFGGFATIDKHRYAATWTGTILPPNSDIAVNNQVYFTLTGSLTPDPADPQLGSIEQRWGLNPTVALTGSINGGFQMASLKLAGTVTPAPGSQYAGTQYAGSTIHFDLPNSLSDNGPANSPSPSAKAAAPSAASAGGTSFGSLVDFVLVYGLNGSPNFQWKHLTAITGAGSPFITATRTKTDSLAITFVPACREKPINKARAESFWDSLAVCDQLGQDHLAGAGIGYENNSLMILRNFLVRPQ